MWAVLKWHCSSFWIKITPLIKQNEINYGYPNVICFKQLPVTHWISSVCGQGVNQVQIYGESPLLKQAMSHGYNTEIFLDSETLLS